MCKISLEYFYGISYVVLGGDNTREVRYLLGDAERGYFGTVCIETQSHGTARFDWQDHRALESIEKYGGADEVILGNNLTFKYDRKNERYYFEDVVSSATAK